MKGELKQMVFTYLVSLTVIVITVINTLFFKSELEQMFREKKQVFAFHICNLLIILITAFGANAVTTTYILENKFEWRMQLIILLCMILPIYILGHVSFEKYKLMNRKYVKAENGKVLVINERYLKRK